MPAREINPFTALTRIRYQFLRTQWSTSNHQRVNTTALQTAQPSGLAFTFLVMHTTPSLHYCTMGSWFSVHRINNDYYNELKNWHISCRVCSNSWQTKRYITIISWCIITYSWAANEKILRVSFQQNIYLLNVIPHEKPAAYEWSEMWTIKNSILFLSPSTKTPGVTNLCPLVRLPHAVLLHWS